MFNPNPTDTAEMALGSSLSVVSLSEEEALQRVQIDESRRQFASDAADAFLLKSSNDWLWSSKKGEEELRRACSEQHNSLRAACPFYEQAGNTDMILLIAERAMRKGKNMFDTPIYYNPNLGIHAYEVAGAYEKIEAMGDEVMAKILMTREEFEKRYGIRGDEDKKEAEFYEFVRGESVEQLYDAGQLYNKAQARTKVLENAKGLADAGAYAYAVFLLIEAKAWKEAVQIGDILLEKNQITNAFDVYSQCKEEGKAAMLRARDVLLERKGFSEALLNSKRYCLPTSSDQISAWIEAEKTKEFSANTVLRMLMEIHDTNAIMLHVNETLEKYNRYDDIGKQGMEFLISWGEYKEAASIGRTLMKVLKRERKMDWDMVKMLIDVGSKAADINLLQEMGTYCAQFGDMQGMQETAKAGVLVCTGLLKGTKTEENEEENEGTN